MVTVNETRSKLYIIEHVVFGINDFLVNTVYIWHWTAHIPCNSPIRTNFFEGLHNVSVFITNKWYMFRPYIPARLPGGTRFVNVQSVYHSCHICCNMSTKLTTPWRWPGYVAETCSCVK